MIAKVSSTCGSYVSFQVRLKIVQLIFMQPYCILHKNMFSDVIPHGITTKSLSEICPMHQIHIRHQGDFTNEILSYGMESVATASFQCGMWKAGNLDLKCFNRGL